MNSNFQNLAHNTKEVILFDDYESLKTRVSLSTRAMEIELIFLLSTQIEFRLKIGAGGVMVAFVSKDDSNNICGCGSMPILRTISQITRGSDCIIKKCP